MTQQDKELLIKDLCARLPYGVKVNEGEDIYSVNVHLISSVESTLNYYITKDCPIKPILFPMSAITQEIEVNGKEVGIEEIINKHFEHYYFIDSEGDICIADGEEYVYCREYRFIIDAFNKYHIDYRGLIDKGLAISVFDLPENPYK